MNIYNNVRNVLIIVVSERRQHNIMVENGDIILPSFL